MTDREEMVRRVQKRIGAVSRGRDYPPLSFTLLPSEIRAAAEAAVDEMAKESVE